MIIQKELHSIKEYLICRKRYVDKSIQNCPSGSLYVETRNGKSVLIHSYFEQNMRHRHKITPDDPLVSQLLRKELLLQEQANLITNYKALITCGKQMEFFDPTIAMHQIKLKYPMLDNSTEVTALLDPDAQAWESMPFEQLDYKPEEKRHVSSRGLKVRSKSELLIIERLYDSFLPVRYEQIIYLSGHKMAPDFTIRRPDGKIFYWEHWGLTSADSYLERQNEKTQIYVNNGIVPWDNLIITYDTADGNLDLRIIKATIESRLLI